MASQTEEVIVRPIMPGSLTVAEIAELSNSAVTTIRGYRSRPGSTFPQPDWFSGTTPLWYFQTIIDWLATRRHASAEVVVQEDGSLLVKRSNDYRARKATGKVRVED